MGLPPPAAGTRLRDFVLWHIDLHFHMDVRRNGAVVLFDYLDRGAPRLVVDGEQGLQDFAALCATDDEVRLGAVGNAARVVADDRRLRGNNVVETHEGTVSRAAMGRGKDEEPGGMGTAEGYGDTVVEVRAGEEVEGRTEGGSVWGGHCFF